MRVIVSSLLLVGWVLGQTAPKPVPAEPDDPGPPVLKRGGGGGRKPAETKLPPRARLPEVADEPPAADPSGVDLDAGTALARTGPPDAKLDLIERARYAAADFTSELPNFICDQLTLRSTSSTRTPKWKLDDRVEVELLYLDGKEEYRNPRINGRPLKKGSLEETGQWSRGDFGTTLADVMSPSTAAKFNQRGTDRIAGLDVVVFDFTVEQQNSHWRIEYGASIKPAYKGAIYVDPQSARVLRIEMQARQLPSTSLLDTIEMTVEYGWVTIAGNKYLLPVRSENLGCFRGGYNCSRNEIEFRNYRKFGVESTISTTDSSIDFGAAEPPKPPPLQVKP